MFSHRNVSHGAIIWSSNFDVDDTFLSIQLFTVEVIETLLSLTSRKFIDNLPVDNKFKMKFKASASSDLLYPCWIELCHTLFKGFFPLRFMFHLTPISTSSQSNTINLAPHKTYFSPLLVFLFPSLKMFEKIEEKASSNSSSSSLHRFIVLCCVFMGDYSIHFTIKGKILAQESFCWDEKKEPELKINIEWLKRSPFF